MAGWGCGGSGGNHPQNPNAEPPMKYSGCSAQFLPCCRRKHHEYCRWALKFQGCHVSGHCHHGKSLCRDMSHLRQPPVTPFSLFYPKNWWWWWWWAGSLKCYKSKPTRSSSLCPQNGLAQFREEWQEILQDWGKPEVTVTPPQGSAMVPTQRGPTPAWPFQAWKNSLSISEGFILHVMSFPGQSPPEGTIPFSSACSHNLALPVFI